MAKKLTKNQQIFVDEYVKDRNGSRAYKVAYKAVKKDETARVCASQLLTKPNIEAAIQEALQKIHEEAKIEAADIRKELAKIGFSDIRKIFTEHGALKRPQDWDDDTAASIQSVEVVTKLGGVDGEGNKEIEYVHKIKTWDKKGSLELLGKELKMFTEQRDLNINQGPPVDKIAADMTEDEAAEVYWNVMG